MIKQFLPRSFQSWFMINEINSLQKAQFVFINHLSRIDACRIDTCEDEIVVCSIPAVHATDDVLAVVTVSRLGRGCGERADNALGVGAVLPSRSLDCSARVLAAGVLGDGLGALGDGMLG
jgi:hypothetical protein